MELFLSTNDYVGFEEPRKIIEYDFINISNRVVMRAKVDIPVIGQKYGYGGQDIDILYLVGRFDDGSLRELTNFPVHVHVLIPKPDHLDFSTVTEMINIVWAVVYDNLDDAKNHRIY
jgi:hypothetical protein